MDVFNMFLMSNLMKPNNSRFDILFTLGSLILSNFLIGKWSKFFVHILSLLIDKIKKKYTMVDIIGWEFLNNGLYTFEYPHNMTAVNHYVYSMNKSKKFRYFNSKKNGICLVDDIYDLAKSDTFGVDNTPNYMLGEIYNIEVDNDIYITNNVEEVHSDGNNNSQPGLNWKIVMTIKSYKHDTTYIQTFINKCVVKYENYITDRNKNKTYHFIYQGNKSNRLSFNSMVISDFNNPDMQNYETFDNIFHSHKKYIIADIDKLHNIEYYKKTGLKRKKGYLFYGHPGTGKTVTVMAMSNYDHRHIIEVPLSRVKTNTELEAILSLTSINNVNFNPENIIILFDEIDVGIKLNRHDVIESKKHDDKMIAQLKDTLNIGTLLSRLDGIGNYGGLIIVATCNNIDNINKALYRDGRLNLMKFDYATIDDMCNIISKYYECDIDEILLSNIRKLDNNISHAKLRCNLEHFNNPIDLINNLTQSSSS